MATTAEGVRLTARAVIIATGAFQVPVVPSLADHLTSEVLQYTPSTYQNPGQVPLGRVLVVGDGASGRQIALDLAPTHQVMLAGGKRRNLVPQRVLGRDLFFWLDRLDVTRVDRDSAIGRLLRTRDPIPGTTALKDGALCRAGIRIYPRLVRIRGRIVTFDDGRTEEVDTVVWAAGCRDDISWLAVPGAVDEAGFIQDRGRTPVPGLFHVGRSWQTCRGGGTNPWGRARCRGNCGRSRGSSAPTEHAWSAADRHDSRIRRRELGTGVQATGKFHQPG